MVCSTYIHTCVHIHTYLITNTCNPKTNLHTTYYVCTPTCSLLEPRDQAIIVVCMVCRLEFSFLFLILQIIADFANYWWYWQLAVVEQLPFVVQNVCKSFLVPVKWVPHVYLCQMGAVFLFKISFIQSRQYTRVQQ